jgi:hypothetical protein
MPFPQTEIRLSLNVPRDPSNYPNSFTIFEGEMRRRVWCCISGMECLFSLKASLPSTILTLETDTQLPGNYHHRDLYPGSKILPQSRPLSEPTPVTYLIVKYSVLLPVAEIMVFLNSLAPYYYPKVLELDATLRKAYEDLPAYWKHQPVDESTTSESLFGQRLQIEFLYHQSMCLLHRKFLLVTITSKDTSPEHTKSSRESCLESALSLLKLQELLFSRELKKKVASAKLEGNIPWHRVTFAGEEFIFAAIVVCIEVRAYLQSSNEGNPVNTLNTTPDQDTNEGRRPRSAEELIQTLNRARYIWSVYAEYDPGALRIATFLSSVIAVNIVGQLDELSLRLESEERMSTSPSYAIRKQDQGVENRSFMGYGQEIVDFEMDLDWVSCWMFLDSNVYAS